MKIDKDKTLKKWGPILNKLGINNEKLCIIISLYCELFSIKSGNVDTGSQLPLKLKEIVKKLNLLPKIKIVGYWYSRVSGKIEYELENGDIVECNYSDKFELTNDQLNDLFGELTIDVLKEVDIEAFRENRIDDILNE